MFFGSSLIGRQYGTKKLINVAVKAPIIIEETQYQEMLLYRILMLGDDKFFL